MMTSVFIKKADVLSCFYAILFTAVFTSCEKEPLNAECDIETASLPGDVLVREPMIENDKVTFILKNGTEREALAPVFTLTTGAVINPPSGTVRDFTVPQIYTVTSEDKKWHKDYTVSATYITVSLQYDFEHVKLDETNRSKYDVFYEVGIDGKETLTWASGNPGFALTGMAVDKPADVFPTYQVSDGRSGNAVAMTTRLTGSFGALVNKPLASGNLFLGRFDLATALSKPLESTKFGTPFSRVPLNLKGYYMYTPGETYMELDKTASDKLRPIPGKTDECNIYAVFFETTDGVEFLDGTNVMSDDNPNIVAVAAFEPDQRTKTSGWTAFNLPFKYREGKTVDLAKLADGHYSITICFASSMDGDYFSGAPGSTLIVDEVELVCYE
ncbi:MAG: PCMD domain-containing protein [Muribaculum sp.]|nr:PCMD domain-containing protein [Muribaculum sp.]